MNNTANDATVGAVARQAWALLLSVGLVMAGIGLQGSLLGVRAGVEGFDPRITGVVLGAYYLGYLAGSAWVPSVIRSVGHVRAFAGLASLVSVTSVVHGVWLLEGPWLVLRFFAGACIAGLFVVAESWLTSVSTSENRGVLLGLYMAVVTGGVVVGQLLLNVADPNGFVLFVVASSLLSFAVVPMAFVPQQAPALVEARSFSIRRLWTAAPLALVAGSVSGFGGGVAVGYGAVFAIAAGFGVAGASQVVAAVLVGGVAGQFPLGALSDRVDRRLVIAATGAIASVSSGIMVAGTSASSLPVVLIGATGLGFGIYPLYSLGLAHLGDYLDPEDVIGAGASMIMVNGLGAACGPITASVIADARGPRGMFEAMIVAAIGLTVYALYRPLRRSIDEEHKRPFAVLAPTATSVVLEVEFLDDEEHWPVPRH